MRHVVLLLGGLLVLATGVGAQQSLSGAPAQASSFYSSAFVTTSSEATVASPSTFAMAEALPSISPSANSAEPQGPLGVGGVQGVFPQYNWQLYGGYTFVRLFTVPGTSVSRNGFDISMSRYLRSGHFGLEGALTTTFGSQNGQNSNFLLAGGGPRVRWSAPRGLEVWAHGLGGWGHFGPQTAIGSIGAVAYEVGGGVDITGHRQRLAYRLEGDMVGTRFFNTTQYSPKISAGIVFKF
ncbi:MAG TPA: hypothetical protein VNE63_04665 [Candidatus Acidoferrales bacterium]|nr:hypothetical protein [Candidatus Acidoferrales bacterium]